MTDPASGVERDAMIAHDDPIWFVDTEGNGRNPGEIIELAAAEMVGWVFTGRHHSWRFRPQETIHQRATQVHGMVDEDVRNCPRIEDVLPEIRQVLGNHAIGGHAVKVEITGLRRVMPDWNPSRAYDTLRLARDAFPTWERHRLSHVGDRLGLSDAAAGMTGGSPHSALYDAVLSGLVMQSITKDLDAGKREDVLDRCEIIGLHRKAEMRARLKEDKRRLMRKAHALRMQTNSG